MQKILAVNLKGTAKNLLEPQTELLLMRLASRQLHVPAGCKKILAVNLKRTAKNLFGPQTEFLSMRLDSRQPHVLAVCRKNFNH